MTEPVELDIRLERLRALEGTKWARDGADFWPAWVADTDITPPQVVIDAVRPLVDRADFGYPRPSAPALADAFAAFSLAEHGWEPDPERLQVFDSSLQAIELALWLDTEPGDGVVLFTPIYPPFIKAVEATGRRIVDCPLDPDGWRLDPDRLAAAIDDTTRVILLCNPHNPTGRVFDRAELAAIAAVAEAHDLLVISDEIWSGLVHPGAAHLPFPLVGDAAAARTMTVSSASKSFNLAGMRCAIAHLGDAGIEQAFRGLPPHALGAVSVFGASASLAAWTSGRPYLDAVRSHLDVVRHHLARRLSADLPDVGWQLPEATYLAWLDFRALGLGPDPAALLKEQAKVVLSPGPDFGPLGNGFARLNFATSTAIVDELIERIAATVHA